MVSPTCTFSMACVRAWMSAGTSAPVIALGRSDEQQKGRSSRIGPVVHFVGVAGAGFEPATFGL